MASDYTEMFLKEAHQVIDGLDKGQIDAMVSILADCRAKKARLFFLGVGGSAGNCSHAVNDFRKIAGIEAYAPTDNVSELTARTNDEGWATVFEAFLECSHATERDALFVLSVGGGDEERNVSPNIVRAINEAKRRGMRVMGIVGRDGGHTSRHGDAVVLVPVVDPALITPLTEAFQAVIWHALVSHPQLQRCATKWESMTAGDGPR